MLSLTRGGKPRQVRNLSRERLGTFVAVLLGTTILAAALLLLASARPQVPERFAELSVVVRSPAAADPVETFAESVPWSADQARRLADDLRRIPGVTAVVSSCISVMCPVASGSYVGGSTLRAR
jgi:putative ABC transport system permease protein